MALFQSDLKETVRRLSNKEFQTNEERDELLARIVTAENIRARDVAWMLFRPDRMFREPRRRCSCACAIRNRSTFS